MNYKSPRWMRKSQVILKKYNYLCQESRRYGKSVQAEVVHHIYPIELYPELAFEDWNLIPLSKSEHNTMHDRDTHEITAKGRYWQEKVRDKFESFMNKKSDPPLLF